MEMSAEISDLAKALTAAQLAMKGATKDSVNPAFRSKYADLSSVWEACREPLAKNGLSVIQAASANGCDVSVTTLLLHVTGQWVKESLTIVAKDHQPQSVGSALSYARRYGLSAMVGVYSEDDDANAAQGQAMQQAPAPRPQQAAARPPLPGANRMPPVKPPSAPVQPISDKDIPF